MEWKVQEAQTLLAVLKQQYPDSSNNTLRDWIAEGRVLVDGVAAQVASRSMEVGQRLQLLPQGPRRRRDDKVKTPIVYEDRYLTVVDKRAGLLSVATDHDAENTVHYELKQRYYPHKVFVIHRLDQGTSGLMIFGRDAEVLPVLKEQLAGHAIDRRYLTIVAGVPEPQEGTWRSYLYEDKRYYVHSSDDPSKGEEAITHYRVIAQHNGFSLLEVTLATGKKNQIRVHCQRAGVPVAGDDKYGGPTTSLGRLGLHAYALHFLHPKTKQPLAFYSAIPAVFTKLIPAKLWLKPPFTLARRPHAGA